MNMVICPKCQGEKVVRETDIMRAKTVTVQCPECHGTGQKDGVIPDGIYVKPEPGVLHYFLKYVNGRAVAHVQTIIEKVQPPKGVLIQADPYFVVSIINMKTRNKDRKKGYCGDIIDTIKRWNNSSVKFILTSWDDSSEYSRAFLLKRDFVRKNKILMWRRPDAAETKCERKNTSVTNDKSSSSEGPGDTKAGGDSIDSQADRAGDSAQLGGDPQGAGSPVEAGADGTAIS